MLVELNAICWLSRKESVSRGIGVMSNLEAELLGNVKLKPGALGVGPAGQQKQTLAALHRHSRRCGYRPH